MKKKKPKRTIKCMGCRRYGGIFTLGPVRWVDCPENAVVLLRVKQGLDISTFPACQVCWKEATVTTGMQILKADPL